MSQVYSTEPATTGRVVLDTTYGPIDIDLWCKECPTTTRTFIQLCLDGYYDDMIFHRILENFLIQTGLTRDGTTIVSETLAKTIDGYLRTSSTAVPSSHSSSGAGDALGHDRKRLEVNPRIRFNHRGQVAMAYPLELEDSNDNEEEEESAMLRYQFFITLDEAPFLDAKHVVFGTVAGPTVFNALRIGRTDADETTGVPVDIIDAPPRIKGVRIDYHPFEDLVVTKDRKIPWKVAKKNADRKDGKEESEIERRKKNRMGKRDFNVLSFGDEERDYEEISSTFLLSKGLSSSKKVDDNADNVVKRKRASADKKEEIDQDTNDVKMGEKQSPLNVESISKIFPSEQLGREFINNVPKVGQLESNVVNHSSNSNIEQDNNKSNTTSRGMSAVEARRTKYLKSGLGSSANKTERLKREGDTMARLFAFTNKVIETKGSGKVDSKAGSSDMDNSLASRMAQRVKQTEDEDYRRQREEEAFAAMPGYNGNLNNNEDRNEGNNWLGTTFKCKRHMDQDSRMSALDKIKAEDARGGDGRRIDDYVVLDEKWRSDKGGRHNEHKKHHNGGTGRSDHAGSGRHAGRSSGHHRST